MDMEVILAQRIAVLEGIIAQLHDSGQNRLEYYQEKCDSYRHILAALAKKQKRSKEETRH